MRKYTIQPISYAAVPTLDIDWQSDCTVRLERYDCCMLHVTVVDEAVSSSADFIVGTADDISDTSRLIPAVFRSRCDVW